MGRPEVEDTPDRWVPPVSERERGEKRRWAGAILLGRERMMGRGEDKEGEGGEWALGRMGKGFGVWVCFFPFFQIFFKQLFQPLSKSNLLHFFNLFHKLF
jgi:hypothetical protein